MGALNVLAPEIGLVRACAKLHISRASVYRDDARRRRLSGASRNVVLRPNPPLALSAAERQSLLDTLCSERFVDCAPRSVYATLLDEGHYHGSIRTMYRLLAARAQIAGSTQSADPPDLRQARTAGRAPARSGLGI